MVKVEVYKAVDHFPECKEFIIGHRKVLQVFDIANITSASLEWAFSPVTHIIVIRRTDNNKLIGGARIQESDGKLSLPMEDAVLEMDPSVTGYINNLREGGGVAEICGLWNTREAAKLGIGSYFMTRVALGISTQLRVKSLVMLCAPSTVKMAQDMGSEIIMGLGDEGKFYYPKLDLVATTMVMPDIYDLSKLSEFERDNVMEFRNNRIQTTEYVGKRGVAIEVDYNLEIA